MKIIQIENILKDHPDLKHKFQDIMPELIKRLIRATSQPIEYIRLPSGDATGTPSLDGILRTTESNSAFIPSGESFWEIGTSGLKKINSDYNKRTSDIPYERRKDVTFILVTPKNWSFSISLDKWCDERKNEWKDVRIFDASIINDWLEINIDVAFWLLNALDITQSVLDASWIGPAIENLVNSTKPSLTSRIFCENRNNARESLLNDLYKNEVTYVKSESTFESLGFILFTILESNNENLMDNVLVINNKDSFEYLNNTLNNKIFIINFEHSNLKQRNNKLIIPCYRHTTSAHGIDLNLRGKNTMYNLLMDIGLNANNAMDVNSKSNGNLLIIKSIIARDAVSKLPQWANQKNLINLFPLLILQNFDRNNVTHQQIAEYLTNKTFNVFEEELLYFVNQEDCPFRIIDNTILQLYNIEETWYVLGKYINASYFEKLCNLIHAKFCNNTLCYGHGNKIDLSENVRLSTALKALALYALYTDENQIQVDNFISSLLKEPSHINYLIIGNLTMLAECSPTVLCTYLDEEINKSDSFILNSLKSRDYVYILDALNYLLCLNFNKIKAINILFRITKLDIKYSFANNPKSDLINALDLRFYNNALSLTEKYEILKNKIEENEEYIRYYFKILTPNSYFFAVRYNVRKPDFPDLPTQKELNEYVKKLNELVLEKILSNNNFDLMSYIIQNYCYFPKNFLEKISEYFKNNRDNISDELLYNIYRQSINQLAITKKFQNKENWSDQRHYIPVLTSLMENTKPRNLFLQYKYLFEGYFDDIDISDKANEDFKREEIKNDKLRKEAINNLINHDGKKTTIINIINNILDDVLWGAYFSKIFIDRDELDIVFDECLNNQKYAFLCGFLNSYEDKSLMIDLFKQKINTETKKMLLPSLILEFEPICIDDDDKYLLYSTKSTRMATNYNATSYDKFLKYNPIGLLDYFLDKVFDDFLYNQGIEVLRAIKSSGISVKNRHCIWELKELFKQLESYHYSKELALLELDFIEYFDHSYPKALVDYWFKNPEFFVQYCKKIMLEPTNYNARFFLLNHLELNKEHFEDTSQFNNFCETIITENKDELLAIVGCILGKSIIGKDGIFPHENTRTILEKNINVINQHFIIGYTNSIGFRYVSDGQKEFAKEKELIQDAEKLMIKYPVTSRLLIELSKEYKSMGKEDSKLDLLGFD